jgi:NADH-quinone oxidoreductase subunit E
MAVDVNEVDAIIERHGAEQRALIPALLDMQHEFHYLPQDVLFRVADRLALPLVQVYQVASFYKALSLQPRGEHEVTVCLGTACHVRGGARLMEQIERLLHVQSGETTPDQQFTLEAVNCVGCCALGPVMIIDGKYYGSMAASKVDRVLESYMANGSSTDDEEAAGNG